MTHAARQDIRLLYFDDCPNWRVAEARLKEVLEGMGADVDSVMYVKVNTPEQAATVGFRGSPTILVDGVDPFAGAEDPAGLACRIYRTAQGTEPAPTVEQLRAVLAP